MSSLSASYLLPKGPKSARDYRKSRHLVNLNGLSFSRLLKDNNSVKKTTTDNKILASK